jgi:hypothetical protein
VHVRPARVSIEQLLVALVVLLASVALRLPVPVVPGAFHDDAVYLALGRSLADGDGYRSIYLPGAPVHTKYPPGLPAVYAVVWMLAGSLHTTVAIITALNVVLVSTAAAILWRFARTTLGLSAAIAAPCVVAPFLIEASLHLLRLPLSEPFFLLGWAVGLLAFARLVERPTIAGALATGFVLGATLLFRTQALPLLVAALGAAAFLRLPARMLGALSAGLFVPISVWHAARRLTAGMGPASGQPDEWSYFAFLPLSDPGVWPAFFVSTWKTIAGYYWIVLPNMLASPRIAGVVALMVAIVAGVAGAVLAGRKGAFLTTGLALSALTVLSWPFAQDRMVLVLLPFAGLLVGVAIQATVRRTVGRWRAALIAALAATGVLIGVRQRQIRAHVGSWENTQAAVGFTYAGMALPTLSTLIVTADVWLEEHADTADVLLFEHGPAPFLTSGRRVVSFPHSDFVDQLPIFQVPGAYLAASIAEDSVSLIAITAQREPDGRISIADTPLADELLAVMARCPNSLELAGVSGRAPSIAFYRVVEGGECLAGLRVPNGGARPMGPRR